MLAPRLTPLHSSLLLALFAGLLSLIGAQGFFVGDDYDFLLKASAMGGWADAARMTFWGEWEPVLYLSWYLDYRWWHFNPLGYHLTSTLLFGAAVIGLFWLVRSVWPQAPLAAWAAALLFASHPVHDEAVLYLVAARGHLWSTALAVLTLLLYARARLHAVTRSGRACLLAAALTLAFLAALAKETALTLAVWIGILEWSLVHKPRSAWRAFASGIGAGVLFLAAAAASMALRYQIVGFHSNKLRGISDDVGALHHRLLEELPVYTLVGAVPLPFGWLDYPTAQRFRVLGWAVLATALLGGAAALWVTAFQRQRLSPALSLCAIGLIIAVVSLAPVFWADLPIRRRYLYAPSVGIVLIAAGLLQGAARHFPRAVRALLAVLVVVGGGVMVQRNLLYLRSGEVARNLIETARGSPVDHPPERASGRPPRIALLTLPRSYGGDFLSGAYLLHESDLSSAFRLFGVAQPSIDCALRCYYAEDYHASASYETDALLRLTVSFRTQVAFDAARERNPRRDRRGRLLTAYLVSEEPESRTLTYRVALRRPFGQLPNEEILLYSDGSAYRLPAPPPPSDKPSPLVRPREKRGQVPNS